MDPAYSTEIALFNPGSWWAGRILGNQGVRHIEGHLYIQISWKHLNVSKSRFLRLICSEDLSTETSIRSLLNYIFIIIKKMFIEMNCPKKRLIHFCKSFAAHMSRTVEQSCGITFCISALKVWHVHTQKWFIAVGISSKKTSVGGKIVVKNPDFQHFHNVTVWSLDPSSKQVPHLCEYYVVPGY